MLATLFAKAPGFVTARLRTDKQRKIIGFVEYCDVDAAQRAMDLLQVDVLLFVFLFACVLNTFYCCCCCWLLLLCRITSLQVSLKLALQSILARIVLVMRQLLLLVCVNCWPK
jgi:hypothetical protein